MSPVRRLCLVPLLLGSVGPVVARAQGPAGYGPGPREVVPTGPSDDRRDLTLVYRVSERTFVHRAAGVSFTVPEGWAATPAHRTARTIDPRPSTVLGVGHAGRAGVALLAWTQLDPGARPADWARGTAAGGEYGEEYETLKEVYGKDRVTVPDRFGHGRLDGFRIDIRRGPGPGGPGAGTLFVFAAESAGTTWLLKVRVSSAEEGLHAGHVRAVMAGYTLLPDSMTAGGR